MRREKSRADGAGAATQPRWSLRPAATAGFLGVLLLLLIVALVSIRTTSMFIETTRSVSHTRKMLEELRQWHALVEITDGDEVRYLFSGDPRFKQAVEKDLKSLPKEFNDVTEALREDDPAQRAAIEEMHKLAVAREAFMARQIFEKEHQQSSDDPQWVRTSDDLLWQMRRPIDDFINTENDLVQLRTQRAERLGRQVLIAVPAAIAISLCTLLTTAFLLNREVKHRIRAENEVRQASVELDRRVRERTSDLRTALSELESFSYSVAHDLRIPIRAIGGYSSILSEDYGEALPEDGKKLLRTVRDEAERMGRLIDDLLHFSRLTRQPMAAVPVDMTQCAEAAFEELATAAPDRKVDFRLSQLPQVPGDAAMLRQVWLNLISNAVKFTGRKQTAVIEVSGVPSASENIYSVKDNGAGFDMRFAGKLFGPFQRLHDDNEFPGTGIGLALVERIIHRHHGRVWAEGEPEHGATFFFALPQHQA